MVTNGAEEAFDFSFGSAIAHGGVDEDGAEASADLGELFGGVVGAVVGVDGFGDAAFVEGALEAIDEVFAVVGVVEASVGDDAGGVVDEGDEVDLSRCWSLRGVGLIEVAEVGSVEGVDLPEVVGVGFGKGESAFGLVWLFVFEEVVFVDGSTEGVGGDLVAAEVTLLDAGAVKGLDVEGTCTFAGPGAGVEGRKCFFDSGEDVFGGELSQGAAVGADGCFGDAVFAVVIPPGLDGSPSELAGLAVFVEEGHFADGAVACVHGVAGCVFEGSEDAHFEVVGDSFHGAQTVSETMKEEE